MDSMGEPHPAAPRSVPPNSILFGGYRMRRPKAAHSFATSLLVHSTAILILWGADPRFPLRSYPEPTVDELIAKAERRIVWYPIDALLPKVAPTEGVKVDSPADRPRFKLPQPVTANDPNPQSTRQKIIAESPEIEIQTDQPLPNMLAWKAPAVEQPRFEQARPRLVAPSTQSLQTITAPPDAPKIDTAQDWGLDPTMFKKLSRLRFQRNQEQQQAPEAETLTAEAAPEIDPARARANLDPGQFQQLPRLRYQAEREQRKAPDKQALTGQPAPQVQANVSKLDGAQFQQLSRLRYQSKRASNPDAPKAEVLSPADAPVVTAASPTQPGLNPSQYQQLSRLRYQAGGGGRVEQAPEQQAITVGAPAPRIEARGGGQVDASQFQQLSKLRYQGGARARQQAAPSRAAIQGAAPAVSVSGGGNPAGKPGGELMAALTKTPDIAPPPSLGAGGGPSGGTGSDRNQVVVGISPSQRQPAEPLKGSRTGSFSGGPDGGPGGGIVGAEADQMAHLRVPNLSVGGPNSTIGTPRAGSGKPEAFDLDKIVGRRALHDMTMAPAPTIEYTIDEKPIDLQKPFVGRPVYSMTINMPNVTSYSGSWVVQFAEADVEEGDESKTKLTAPWLLAKVDPRYSASAAQEKIEGEVVLYARIQSDGEVTNVRIVKGLDPRLDDSARQAFAKWRFEPARRYQDAIAVEALVRIPFRLNPDIKVRY